jgi:thiamine-phosphate pyrophosphorylase
MKRRQTSTPLTWLFTDERLGEALWSAIGRLPRGSGIVVRHHGAANRRELLRRIHRIARARGLLVVDEAKGEIARVHDVAELRRALLRKAPLIFISPLHRTRSHPDQRPLPRMRAATLARLAGQPVLGLGGMDARRFRAFAPLGFAGWGAIDAWDGKGGA